MLNIKIYNTPDNKTIDIIQDSDKIVLTHKESIDLANHILKLKYPKKIDRPFSESQVISMLEALRQMCEDIAESYKMKPFEKHKCIKSIDLNQFLPPNL